ncbi:MAG TPA: hypothetical protein VF194_13915 [Ferrovibrio sp.]|uniref:hypothetical protein n=1 Tax=Ferrovibrio sp. TaxID=1917215 RepID=UPI002ED1CE4F
MIRLHYPFSRLWPDYLRSLLGLAFCLGLLLFATPQSVIFVLLAGLSLLFAWLGASAIWRQQIEVQLDASGVACQGRWGFGVRRRVVEWSGVSAVVLRYYSTRRDRGKGWLQLTIEGHGGRLSVDSDMIGFPQLVREALAAARRLDLPLSETTLANAARLADAGREGVW